MPYYPSPDAIAEIRVDTNNYSAEYGNVAGASSSASRSSRAPTSSTAAPSCSGATTASPPTAGTTTASSRRRRRPNFSQHIFGAHARRPADQEQAVLLRRLPGLRPATGRARRVASVAPEVAATATSPSLLASGTVIAIPRRVSRSPDNQIPQSRFSPIAQAILATPTNYPLPNRSGLPSNYVSNRDRKIRNLPGRREARLDASAKDRLSLRGSYQHYTSETDRDRAPDPARRAPRFADARAWPSTGRASSARPPSTSCASAGARSVLDNRRSDWAGIGDYNAIVGIPGGQAIAGLSAVQHRQLRDRQQRHPGVQRQQDLPGEEKLSLSRGRHCLRVGGQWLHSRQGFDYSGNRGCSATSTSTGAFTGFGFSDFLLDQVAQKGGRRHGSLGPSSRTGSASSSRTTSRCGTT